MAKGAKKVEVDIKLFLDAGNLRRLKDDCAIHGLNYKTMINRITEQALDEHYHEEIEETESSVGESIPDVRFH